VQREDIFPNKEGRVAVTVRNWSSLEIVGSAGVSLEMIIHCTIQLMDKLRKAGDLLKNKLSQEKG
jgi:hypothetical protein